MAAFLTSRYVSWATLLVALLLWSGVVYFAWTISAAAEGHRASVAAMEEQTSEQAFALQLHALARDTKEGRARLEEISRSDLAEILDTIEMLGKDTGLSVHMTQAPSVRTNEPSPIKTVSISVEAQGSYTKITQLISLIETLPMPSALDDLRLEHTVGEKPPRSMWRLVADVRVFTISDIPTI